MQRAFAVILFPITVLSVVFAVMALHYTPPHDEVSIEVRFGEDHVNVSEFWVFSGGSQRRFPWPNMSITGVHCSGQSFISYDGSYSVSCEGSPVLGVEYTLLDPYTCYEDMCYFSAKFYEGPRTLPAEFKVVGANDFATFPAEGSRGEFRAAVLSASLPNYYSGPRTSGEFYRRFLDSKRRLGVESRLESNWGSNLFLVVTFESFMAFLVFLLMGLNPDVKDQGHSWFPPSQRPPHELRCLFFRDLPWSNVVSATIIDLARNGYIEVVGKKLRVISDRAEGYPGKVLSFLSRLSRKGEIVLDRDWIDARVEELGRPFRRMLGELRVDCPQDLIEETYDRLGDYFVLLLQSAFLMIAVGMLAASPSYLVNFRSSMVVLALVNLFWMVLTLRLGCMTFSRYTHAAALEKAAWLAYRNFSRSQVNLEKESRVDWDYLLVFATLLGFESKVLPVAERKQVNFKNIYDPRSAVNAFDLILRAVGP